MHRSITLSEIVSSTFTNNADELRKNQSKKDKFVLKIGIGLIEFLAASLYQCYGIILAQYIELGIYPLEKATWTTFIYLASWHLTAPWSKFFIDLMGKRGCFPYKTVIIISTLLIALGMVIQPYFICYGIFGGIFTNIIQNHLKNLLCSKYKSTERTFKGNILSARAISLLIMPHIILMLTDYYTLKNVNIIYAAFILNIIPVTLILKEPKTDSDLMHGISRYHTLPVFSQQMKEMKVFSTSANTSDIKHNETFVISGESSDEIESESEEEKDDESDDLLIQEENMAPNEKPIDIYLPPAPLTPATVELYYSHAGVKILPKIIEETDDIEETNINIIDSKRLSRISATLEEINRAEKQDIIREVVLPTEIVIKPEFIPNYTDRKNTMLRDPCCFCSPYSLFLWKRRLRSGKDFLIDYLFVPLYRSLTDLHFYPILASKVSVMISSNFFISLAPYITLKKNNEYKKDDMAFLLSYIAFSWCLSLVLLPLLLKFSAAKLRVTFVIALGLISCSMLLLTKTKMTNEFITWSCLLFGFGYGLLTFSEKFVYKAFAGKRKYVQFEGILNAATGLFVILIYYLIYNLNIVALFPLAATFCYFVVAIVWIIAPILKKFVVFFKMYFRKKSGSGTFL